MIYITFLGPFCHWVMSFLDALGLLPKQNDDVGALSCIKQLNTVGFVK